MFVQSRLWSEGRSVLRFISAETLNDRGRGITLGPSTTAFDTSTPMSCEPCPCQNIRPIIDFEPLIPVGIMRSVQLLGTLAWRASAKLKNFLRRMVDVFQRLVIKRYASSKKDVFFVQIGSNDADFGDPIKSYVKARCWRGIMVEAVPYVFERLRRNYELDRIRIVCCAITEQSGQRCFYSVKEDKDPSLPKSVRSTRLLS